MKNAARIVFEIESTGATLIPLGGGLKLVAAPGTVSPELRAELKAHKAEIIDIVTRRIEDDPWLTPCCICGGIEFTGVIYVDVESFWCVTCQVVPDGWIKIRRVNSPRVPALNTKPPKQEVSCRSLPAAKCKVCRKDIYESVYGGRFCKACGTACVDAEPINVEEGFTPVKTIAAILSSEDGFGPTLAINRRTLPTEALVCFKVGFLWLKDHLDELLAEGWTRRMLFGRGRYAWPSGNEWGCAWSSSWQDEGKTPSLGDHGQILFTFTTNGEQKQQSIWPGDGLMTFDSKSSRFITPQHEDGRQ